MNPERNRLRAAGNSSRVSMRKASSFTRGRSSALIAILASNAAAVGLGRAAKSSQRNRCS